MLKKCLSLADNPLCGISTYKDSLNLATGAVTRYVKKLVLTGEESWINNSNNACCVMYLQDVGLFTAFDPLVRCSHFPMATSQGELYNRTVDYGITFGGTLADRICIRNKDTEPVTDFKSFLAQQYANGTPVTVWYVLETPETETITVPQGLTGTIEGFLNQDGTPTPTNPIYPTAKTNVWYEIPYRKYGTETDTLTSLPAQIIADGTPMTEWEISGNMVQTGTPTPDEPITPSECGDRTVNLWDENYTGIGTSITYLALNVGDGEFTMSTTAPLVSAGAPLFLLSGNVSSGASTVANSVTSQTSRTVSSTGGYITVAYRNVNGSHPEDYDTMLNSGSTALPYEPYGYKLPITSGNTTTPIYLSEPLRKIGEYADSVQADGTVTRYIKKLVLDGSIPLSERSGEPSGIYYKSCAELGILPVAYEVVCSHFSKSSTNRVADMADNTIIISASTLYIRNTAVDNINTWLASNPVTVWYVLATPTSESIEAPTIPTVKGSNTFDVETTLKPSEVELTYKGWHPHDSKEYSNNQWVIPT